MSASKETNRNEKKEEIWHGKALKKIKWNLTFKSFQNGLKQGGGKKWGWMGNTLQYEEGKHREGH